MQTGGSPTTTTAAAPPDPPEIDDARRTVAALLAGDEATFATLLDRYYTPMLRLAMVYVADRAVAEDVVQDTWVGVLQGLPQFEGRSSLKTWIFRILTNQAQTRGKREARFVPFSALGGPDDEEAEPAVDPARFLPADHPRWPHHWATPPQSWDSPPEKQLLAQETRAYIRQAIGTLPTNQRTVIVMRDVEGWPADEVCNVLGITETHQRVLLHRARAKVRQALEQYLTGDHV
jgi:RNA polymerase sigma-70 factor (ECF subfamily)